MKLNESNVDRAIRAVVGIVLLYLGLGGVLGGTLAIVSDIVGAVLLLTGVIGFCPIYFMLKFGTRK